MRRIAPVFPGQAIPASGLNALIQSANEAVSFRAVPPLKLVNGPLGPILSLDQPATLWFGYPDSTIAARSGTTVSKGTVSIWSRSGTTISDTTKNLTDVYNWWSIEATTTTLVLVQRYFDGSLVIVGIDCEEV